MDGRTLPSVTKATQSISTAGCIFAQSKNSGFTETFCNSLDILTDKTGVLRRTFQLFADHFKKSHFHIKVVLGPFHFCPKINLKKADILKTMVSL